nr:hypothetical protein [uncultured Cohaesibacter sp.]
MTMLISGIGALLGGGGAAAATAGATAAGSAATAGAAAATTASTGLFGTGISASSIIQGVAGFASAVAGLQGATAQAEGYEIQADDADMQATDEETKGVQRTLQIKRALSKALGENAVKYAAAGQLVGEGAAQDNANAMEDRAVDDISVDRADTDARAAMLRARAAGYRKVASRTRSAGAIGFVGNLFA